MFVNFWGVWCGPCLKELPLLDELAKRANQYQVQTLHVGDNPKAIQTLFNALSITHLSQATWPDFEALRDVGFVGLPASLVIVGGQALFQSEGYLTSTVEEFETWLNCLGEESESPISIDG
ncbi:hypothetical protein VOA_000517 [Vibrio sp. RC586]|nr:hypothetical protein VOA_000517 [Vibrio sp. RC586]